MQVLSDAQWAKFEAAIAAVKLRGARPRKEERRTIEAIIWRLDNGAKWRSIPAEVRPAKEQPFYHLFAENEDSQYVAYVSEQNLMSDESGEPVRHPQVSEAFERTEDGRYCARARARLS